MSALQPSPLRDKVLALADGPPPVPPRSPNLTPREGAVVLWLLDRLDKYGVHVPRRADDRTEASHAAGWGMPCPGGDHSSGCPVAAGWEYVALARLWEYANPEPGTPDLLTEPGQPHPFKPGGLFGPWPVCYPRFVHGWHRWDLPLP